MVDDQKRNYQIDVLKMIFTVMIFICHTSYFQPVNNEGNIDGLATAFHSILGWSAVMGFFMISGFLMVKSICKRNYGVDSAGKNSIRFVIDKFKPIALPFWVAGSMYLFCFVIYIYIYI